MFEFKNFELLLMDDFYLRKIFILCFLTQYNTKEHKNVPTFVKHDLPVGAILRLSLETLVGSQINAKPETLLFFLPSTIYATLIFGFGIF